MANEKKVVDIEINGVKANATLKELTAAANVMRNQLRNMTSDDPGRAKLLKDFQAMKGRVSAVSTEINGVTKASGYMKSGFQTAMRALLPLLAIQKVFSFLSDSTEKFKAQSNAVAQLDATLKSTGHSAGLTSKEIQALASNLQAKTLFGDEVTIQAASLLGTFTDIKKGVFEEALPAIQDMATKMAGDGPADLKGATIQVGKALNDPIKGITALSKVGVSFTESQKETIKTMVAMGDKAGAQKLILAELNKEFGGSAEAARKAGTGGFKALQNTLGDLQEILGGKLAKGLNTAADFISVLIDKSEPVVAVFRSFFTVVGDLWHEITGLVSGLGLFSEAGSGAKLVIDILAFAFDLILLPVKILALSFGAVVSGIKHIIAAGHALAETGPKAWDKFTNAIADKANRISNLLSSLFTFDAAKIKAAFEEAKRPMESVMDEFADDFKKSYDGKLSLLNPEKAAEEAELVADATLKVIENSGAKALGLTKEQQKKLLEAQKKYRDAAARSEYELQSLKIELMQDGIDKVLAKLQLQHERELADIAKHKAEVLALEGISQQQKQALVDQYSEQARLKDEQLQQQMAEAKAAQKKADLEKELTTLDEEEALKKARLEEHFYSTLDTEMEREQALYELKHEALLARLELIKEMHGLESLEYQLAWNQMLALDKDHHDKRDDNAKRSAEIRRAIERQTMQVSTEMMNLGITLLGQDETARKKNAEKIKAFSMAKIMIDLVTEIAGYMSHPASTASFGVAGGLKATAATIRAGIAMSNIQNQGFYLGGPTGPGLSIDGGGKMRDSSGFAIAGVVHQDEWVGPKWMYQSPKYADIFNYLEGERLRGFATGGPTTAVSGGAPMPQGNNDFKLLVSIMERTNSLLLGLVTEIRTWQGKPVTLDVLVLQDQLREVQQVQAGAGISEN